MVQGCDVFVLFGPWFSSRPLGLDVKNLDDAGGGCPVVAEVGLTSPADSDLCATVYGSKHAYMIPATSPPASLHESCYGYLNCVFSEHNSKTAGWLSPP